MARRKSWWSRKSGQIRWGRVALILLALGGAGWGIPRLAVYIASRPLFEIHRIRVMGSRLLSDPEAVRLSKLRIGENSFELDLERAARDLTEHPVVRSASVRRRLPDTVDILLVERAPVALVDLEGLCAVDEEGVILGSYPEEMPDLPLLTQFSPPSDLNGGRLAGPGLDEVLRFLAATRRMDPSQVEEISEARLEGRKGATLHLKGHAFEVKVQGEDTERQWAKLRAALSCSEIVAGQPMYLDLRFDGQIVVGPSIVAAAESTKRPSGER